MMRILANGLAVAVAAAALASVTVPAQAACQVFEASHNGTNMFHPTGAEGAAVNKLMAKVDSWQQRKGIKDIRMTKVRTKCGPWFTKYMLPHRHCVAKARACS